MITIDTLIQWEKNYGEDVVEEGPYVYNEDDEKILIPIIKDKLSSENITTIADFDDIYQLHCVIPDNEINNVFRIIMEAFVELLNQRNVDPNLFN